MAKKIYYGEDARKRVLTGAEILYKAVKTTMGPKGRNVIISKSYGNPTVTHDGVTVAKAIDVDEQYDEKEKIDTLGYKVGAELIKQAATKMNDVVGDGTTSVTVLTYHILNEANKLIAAGHDPMELSRAVAESGEYIISELDNIKKDIGKDKKKIADVASISAGDTKIGELIASVIEKVGKDGVVTVEEGQGLALESEVVDGFTFDKGFISPYLVTDTARMEAVYNKPAIVVTDKKIGSIQEILPVLEKLVQSGKKDLVLIAEDVEGDALGNLILNKLKGTFNCVAVKAPAFGDRRKEILQDIAILTGGTVITDEQGHSFDTVEADMIGTARKVIVTKDETTIIEGAGTSAALKARIEQITAQAKNASSEYDKENLDKRRAALSGKVAVIKVGGATETEIEEKKFRVDDAVAAVKAALSDGIVAGGAVTYLDLSKRIKEKESISTHSAGWALMKEALKQPFVQLMTNAGAKAIDSKMEEILTSTKDGLGFDVNHPESGIKALIAEGVTDPAQVTKEVIRNAVSIAGTAMTMGALVVEVPEPKTATPDMGGGMGMGGMM